MTYTTRTGRVVVTTRTCHSDDRLRRTCCWRLSGKKRLPVGGGQNTNEQKWYFFICKTSSFRPSFFFSPRSFTLVLFIVRCSFPIGGRFEPYARLGSHSLTILHSPRKPFASTTVIIVAVRSKSFFDSHATVLGKKKSKNVRDPQTIFQTGKWRQPRVFGRKPWFSIRRLVDSPCRADVLSIRPDPMVSRWLRNPRNMVRKFNLRYARFSRNRFRLFSYNIPRIITLGTKVTGFFFIFFFFRSWAKWEIYLGFRIMFVLIFSFRDHLGKLCPKATLRPIIDRILFPLCTIKNYFSFSQKFFSYSGEQ